MAAQLQAALSILRRKQVEARTGLSRSTIYAKMTRNPKRLKEYDPTFPLPITLGNGAKAVGWVESEINAWLYPHDCLADAQAQGTGSQQPAR